MKRTGQIVFVVSTALALALYGLTAPAGLPWNDSAHLSLAYLGEVVRLPVMPHPFWGFYVQVFGGAVALSAFMAAIAAGFLGAAISRHLDGRIAVSAALVWIFLPGVWNRAVTGERSICLAAMILLAVWILDAFMARILEKERITAAPAVGWSVLGVAVVFALVSLTFHDYRYGEAAGAFAKGIVKAAGGRIIVMNGVCDDQIMLEAKAFDDGDRCSTIAFRNDAAYRESLVAWTGRTWPSETNLLLAAQAGVPALVEAAMASHPERFYLMNGRTTTLASWEARWTDFRPYLNSSDPFSKVARRLFASEGNSLADTMTDEAAYALRTRIFVEVDPGNLLSLIGRSAMICRGYAVGSEELKDIQNRLERFLRESDREHMDEIARAAGSVRTDIELLKMTTDAVKKCVVRKVLSGERTDFDPEILSLAEWKDEMALLMERGDLEKAGRIARMILSNLSWRAFLPANEVMGSVAASEGDYLGSEAFFRLATNMTNSPASTVLKDYARTLMALDRLPEAEQMARQAVQCSDEEDWLARLTLAEVLAKRMPQQRRIDVVSNGRSVGRFVKAAGTDAVSAEIRDLLLSVTKYAPVSARERITELRKDLVR